VREIPADRDSRSLQILKQSTAGDTALEVPLDFGRSQSIKLSVEVGLRPQCFRTGHVDVSP
jgi:hypothetical protein